MALSLLLNKKPQKKIGAITLDAAINEDYTYSSNVTSYPVESGSVVSDHIINDPESFSISGIISQTPLKLLSGLRTERNLVQKSFDALTKIYNDKELVTVVSGLKVFDNMAMTSFRVNRSGATGDALMFDASFTKVTVVETQTTTIPKSSIGGKGRTSQKAQGTAGAGKKAGTSGAEAATQRRSLLHSLIIGG